MDGGFAALVPNSRRFHSEPRVARPPGAFAFLRPRVKVFVSGKHRAFGCAAERIAPYAGRPALLENQTP